MIPQGRGSLYQPTITRLPSLLGLLLITLGLIALTEFACRRLPALSQNGIVDAVGRLNSRDLLVERDAANSIPGSGPVMASPSAYLPLAGQITELPAPSNFLPISEPLPSVPTEGPPSTTKINQFANPSNYQPISPIQPAPTPSQSVYLPLSPPQVSAPAQTAFLPLSSIAATKASLPISSVGVPPPTVFLPLSSTVGLANGPLAVPPSNFLPLGPGSATIPSAQIPIPAPTAFLPGNQTPAPTAINISGGVTGASTNLPGVTPTPPARTGFFQGESYSIGSNGVVIIDGTPFATATPTTATLRGGKVVVVWPTGSVSIQEAKDLAPFKRIYLTPGEYILGAFVPTIIAVLYSIPWHLLASAIQEIEPFYQLQRPDGVTAADSIALDYRASINVIATFTAVTKGHFLVWWSGLISLMVLMVAPLASETVFIGFYGKCTATSGREACSPSLSVFPTAARVLEGMLAFIAVMTLALAISIKRGKSGVYANPLSIAGLATLFQNPHVIESFRQLNPYCTSSRMIRTSLQGHRYRLAASLDDDGTSSYGLVMCYQDPAMIQSKFRTAFRGGKKYASVAVNAVDERLPLKRQRTVSDFFIHPAAIMIFALMVAALEVLIIYYSKTGGDTGFEKFMDSQSFGVVFLFTAVGVLVKMYWSLLDDEVRNMEPYRQLLAGDAKASDSILLVPHTNPFTGIFYSLRNGHFFNAYISLVAILCEPLIVALSNIPFKAGLAYTAYRASSYISTGILSMILLGIVWMLYRKRTPDLVRRPDTVASILLFICGSNMLDDFKGMSLMDRIERDAMVKRWNKKYSMGSVIGVDGVEREGIDENIFVMNTKT